jgi:hypothetical protein
MLEHHVSPNKGQGSTAREDDRMRTLVSGLCGFVLLTALVAGCTDSNQGGGVGDNPNSDRAPSASPPSTMPDTGRAPGSPAPGSEAPKTTPSMPSR